ncbi:MAG: hypothetical protein E7585_06635, partial [Ruminococcaceae bacterium]|nr:hypothetical protein [Oscillospiraceae bacterium]
MRITQYTTYLAKEGYYPGGEFVKKPIFPSVPMHGAHTLTPAAEPVARDFLGFGVAITGSSCYNLSLMEKEERAALLQKIYGKDGLNLSVARLCVGSCDYSAELYSYDDVAGDVELKHFSIDRDRAYVIPMIKEILKIRPDLYLFSSPWSPPGWMKVGGSLGGGYMRDEFVECYAEYYLRFLQAYEAEGIHISAMTPQNETETHQRGKMPACRWHPETEATFIKAMRRRLNEQGMDVKIWMYDHDFAESEPRVHWSLDNIEGLRDAVDGVAFHYYSGAIENTEPLRQAYPDLRCHFTEAGPRLYDHYATDFCKWGIMMSKVLQYNFGSLCGWNLMLDETGGPNVGPFFCGGLITRDYTTGALSYSGQYK